MAIKRIAGTEHSFLLPDELGWACNDEISQYIDVWALKLLPAILSKKANFAESMNSRQMLWEVGKAELMDNVYAIIKKHQAADTSK